MSWTGLHQDASGLIEELEREYGSDVAERYQEALQMDQAPQNVGVLCPSCGSGESIVKETRAKRVGIYRRRKCLCCDFAYSTLENLEARSMKNIEGDMKNLIARLEWMEGFIQELRKDLTQMTQGGS